MCRPVADRAVLDLYPRAGRPRLLPTPAATVNGRAQRELRLSGIGARAQSGAGTPARTADSPALRIQKMRKHRAGGGKPDGQQVVAIVALPHARRIEQGSNLGVAQRVAGLFLRFG